MQLINFTRAIKISVRLLLSFLIITLIPITVLVFYSSNHTLGLVSEKTVHYSFEILRQINRNIEKTIEGYSLIGAEIGSSNTVQEGLSNYDPSDYFRRYSMIEELKEADFFNRYIYIADVTNFMIYTQDGQTYYDLGHDVINNSDRQYLQSKLGEYPNHYAWTYTYTQRRKETLVYLTRIADNRQINKTLGYLYITINENKFAHDTYATVDFGDNSNVFIMNREGLVISSKNDNIKKGAYFPSSDLIDSIDGNNKLGEQTIIYNTEEDSYLSLLVYNRALDSYVVSMIPYTFMFSEGAAHTQRIIIIALCCIVLSLLVALLIYSSIIIPLNYIVHGTHNMIEGNFDTLVTFSGNDELTDLSKKMNLSIRKIHSLIKEVEDVQTEKRKTEILMLQTQINPHFLFNTLTSLKWVAEMSRAKNVASGLSALSIILRNTIIHNDSTVTLGQEIENLESYITIQKIRYGDKLTFHNKVDQKYYNIPILKFLLQPVVENSIIHGFENINYEGVITLDAFREESKLVITVSDNGVGFVSEGTATQINSFGKYGKMSSIGLENVKDRIRLNYGIEFIFSIHGEKHKGTTVIIEIPFKEESDV